MKRRDSNQSNKTISPPQSVASSSSSHLLTPNSINFKQQQSQQRPQQLTHKKNGSLSGLKPSKQPVNLANKRHNSFNNQTEQLNKIGGGHSLVDTEDEDETGTVATARLNSKFSFAFLFFVILWFLMIILRLKRNFCGQETKGNDCRWR